jgi:hypothetical protein
LKSFEFTGPDVRADILEKYGAAGGLTGLFAEPTETAIHKWHHFLPLYDRYFSPYRGKPLKFLEIGVSGGGSLALWRRFFGPEAVIFGIDINPDCAAFDGLAGQVRIGSQDDPAFLAKVVAEMGGIDIVLDDGSHVMDHIKSSLEALFPALSEGGIYMIEDLHTAYGPSFGGGFNAPGNFYNEVRRMIDDMHHWYHGKAPHVPARAAWVSGLHIHDSLVVIDKGKVYPPTHSVVGIE